MRFVFFGTPDFASIVLKKMIEGGCKPDLVICNPDRPFGRKKVITPPPTKLLALKHDIKVLQPEVLSIYNLQPITHNLDFAVVAAYAKIIPKEILALPRLGTIGVHPSLLPKYRGASPIQTAILNGEKETGVTLYLMDEKVDHGPVLENRKWKIESRINYIELQKQLAELAGDLLVETLPKFINGEIKPLVQDESAATLTKKFTTQDVFVDYSDLFDAEAGDLEKALKIHRMIRAFVLEPGIWTMKDGKRVKLLESEVVKNKLQLKKIQVEGEKPKLVSNR